MLNQAKERLGFKNYWFPLLCMMHSTSQMSVPQTENKYFLLQQRKEETSKKISVQREDSRDQTVCQKKLSIWKKWRMKGCPYEGKSCKCENQGTFLQIFQGEKFHPKSPFNHYSELWAILIHNAFSPIGIKGRIKQERVRF